MIKIQFHSIYKVAVIFAGVVCFALAIANLPTEKFDLRFLVFLAAALLVMPRMTLILPRGKFALSFTDAAIFLAFLLYGGATAVFIAPLVTFASCLYLQKSGKKFARLMILFNVAGVSLVTFLTSVAWNIFLALNNGSFDLDSYPRLMLALGFLALTQFLGDSIFIVLFAPNKADKSAWLIWKEDCVAVSLMQLLGAGFAGVVYRLIHEPDFLTMLVPLTIFGFLYYDYRRKVNEINRALQHAEEVEQKKTEKALVYADELNVLLKKNEEQSVEALTESREKLEHAASHDFLTELPNRMYLVERLSLLMEIGIEISHKYYVLFLDIRRFKNINDNLGHSVGDRVLKLIARRLQRLLREEDTVARLGGDEFAIILNDLSSLDEARAVADKIYEKLTRPFLVSSNKIYLDINVGIAPFDIEHKKPEDILRDADIAMHHAKEKGSGVAVFDKKLRAHFLEIVNLELDLRYAVERGELETYFQPLVRLDNGELLGFETLLRWHHPNKGFISPVQFIPIAEDSGLIIPITRWILHEACCQMAEWRKLAVHYQDLLVSINISGKHFVKDEDLLRDVGNALEKSKLPPSALKLEITESTAMENAEYTIKILEQLKDLGVKLSMDDFGTGFSSLSYLHRLPFDSLKIDRSFVAPVNDENDGAEILQTIIALAKNLRMKTFAEGIETETQLALLKKLGCDYGQGFLFSKPMPKHKAAEMLAQNHFWMPDSYTGTFDDVKDLHDEQPRVF